MHCIAGKRLAAAAAPRPHPRPAPCQPPAQPGPPAHSLPQLTILPPVHELQRGADTRWRWVNYSAFDAKSTWDLYQRLRHELMAMAAVLDEAVERDYAQVFGCCWWWWVAVGFRGATVRTLSTVSESALCAERCDVVAIDAHIEMPASALDPDRPSALACLPPARPRRAASGWRACGTCTATPGCPLAGCSPTWRRWAWRWTARTWQRRSSRQRRTRHRRRSGLGARVGPPFALSRRAPAGHTRRAHRPRRHRRLLAPARPAHVVCFPRSGPALAAGPSAWAARRHRRHSCPRSPATPPGQRCPLACRRWAASRVEDAKYMNVGSGAQVQQLLFAGAQNALAQGSKGIDKPPLPLERVFKVGSAGARRAARLAAKHGRRAAMRPPAGALQVHVPAAACSGPATGTPAMPCAATDAALPGAWHPAWHPALPCRCPTWTA